MANFYTTEHKLNLAKSIVATFSGSATKPGYNDSDLIKIQKMEHKYNKSNKCFCDLSDFCIPLSDIPQTHYKFMITINWLDGITEAPVKGQDGFYRSISLYKPGINKVEHFITLDKYIQLLFIESDIKNSYANIKSQN